jgi:hypothetical protein
MGDRVAHLRMGRLKVFADRAELAADPEIGLMNEVRFWESVAAGGALP